jgi:lysophospholipase L1-like esterase
LSGRGRKLRLLAAGTLAALCGFELLLQVLSLSIWWFGGSAAAPVDEGSPRILCVGDSFTYGLGATSRENTYPSQLDAALEARDTDAQVINCGWPGSTSGDLLTKLDEQLAAYRPRIVYVLTGCNDVWRGRAGTAPPADDGFRLEFRTLRFFELVTHWWTTGGNTQGLVVRDDAPFVGEWHAGPLSMHFLPDGRVESESGHMTWSADGDRLVLVDPGKESRIEAVWRIDGADLVLTATAWPAPLRFLPGPRLRHDVDRGERALTERNLVAAERFFRSALGEPTLEDTARLGLVRTLQAAGDGNAARDELEVLAAKFGAEPTTARGVAWVEACLAAGDRPGAAAAAADVLTRVPWNARLLELTVQCGPYAEDRAALRAAIHAGRERFAGDDDLHSMFLEAAATLATGDGTEAVRDMALSFLVSGSPARLRKALLQDRDLFPLERLDAALAALDPNDADRVRAVVAELDRHEGAVTDDLSRNLRRIVEACRRTGAEPVLLAYPKSMPEVEAVLVPFADQADVELLRLREVFDDALRTQDYRDLFVLDGHCNDRGYALMAERVAADAADRLRRDR